MPYIVNYRNDKTDTMISEGYLNESEARERAGDLRLIGKQNVSVKTPNIAIC